MKQQDDYMDELQEWQENQFNPGYYVGNGKVPPCLKAKGNLRVAAISWLFSGVVLYLIGAFFLCYFLININNCDNPFMSIVIMPVIFWILATLSILGGINYLKEERAQKAITYRKRVTHIHKNQKRRKSN